MANWRYAQRMAATVAGDSLRLQRSCSNYGGVLEGRLAPVPAPGGKQTLRFLFLLTITTNVSSAKALSVMIGQPNTEASAAEERGKKLFRPVGWADPAECGKTEWMGWNSNNE